MLRRAGLQDGRIVLVDVVATFQLVVCGREVFSVACRPAATAVVLTRLLTYAHTEWTDTWLPPLPPVGRSVGSKREPTARRRYTGEEGAGGRLRSTSLSGDDQTLLSSTVRLPVSLSYPSLSPPLLPHMAAKCATSRRLSGLCSAPLLT